MKRTLFAMVLAAALLASPFAGRRVKSDGSAPGCAACDQHTWSYCGTTGPDYWGTICAKVCQAGTRQSPIAIAGATYARLPVITYHRLEPRPGLVLKNYGFTPKISYASDADATYIQFSDNPAVKYRFVELHFHTPSEHTLNNRRYEMEMHVVHTDTSNPDNNVVIAVLIKEGRPNSKFDEILRNLPAGALCTGISIPYQNVYDLLPPLSVRGGYYTYPGSLTTPGCSETVKFVVLKAEIELSRPQIETFRAYLHKQGFDKTNRPLQDAHGRKVETNVKQ